jgi:hypothetical protein
LKVPFALNAEDCSRTIRDRPGGLEIPTVVSAVRYRLNGPASQPQDAAKDAPKSIGEVAFEGRSVKRLNVHDRSTVHDIVNITLFVNIVNNRPVI